MKMASADQVFKFERDGYVVLEDFISQDDVKALKTECEELVDKMDPAEHHTVFSTTKQSYRTDYFLNSWENIGYFFEDGALDSDGKLQVDKHRSLNKIGHALHIKCPNFKKVTFSQNVKNLAKALQYTQPIIPQSMYIFKQPGIGGEVTPHQDATFIYTEPQLKVVGIWIALEDATLENGCLWFVPGSHKGGLYNNYRMVRSQGEESQIKTIFIGDKPDYNSYGEYVPVPIKKGSAILIDGLVLHKSALNKSSKSRHIYTFHMFDAGAGTWNENNWLQETENLKFPHLFA